MNYAGRIISVIVNAGLDTPTVAGASILWENLVCKVLGAEHVILDYSHDISSLVNDSMVS